MAFSEGQVKNLEAKLDAKHVRTRRVQDTTLAYVEGGMSSPRPTVSLAMTPGTDTPCPRAVCGRPRRTTTMPQPISRRSELP